MTLSEVDSQSAAVERSVAKLRFASLVFITLAYVVFASKLSVDPWVAGIWLGLAWVYNVGGFVWALRPGFRPQSYIWLMSFADAAFVISWVALSGGPDSPFYIMFYAGVVAIAPRLPERGTLLVSGLYVVGYAGIYAVSGALVERATEFALRAGFILVSVGFAALLRREAAAQAQGRIELNTLMVEARTAEARFRGLVEAAPDAMVICNAEGRIVLVNTQAERVFGYGREELIGRRLDLLVPKVPAMFLEGSTVREHETPGRTKDGTTFPAEVRISPVVTEEGELLTLTFRDLTERKKAEAERLTGVARLKELERLKELDEFKTQFINNAAHELGTPLTPLKLQVHLLKTGSGELTPGQRKSVTILERNVNRLHELVRDVLDVARLQASRLGIRREPMDLNRIVLEAAESFQEPARQAEVELEVRLSPDIVLDADANRLTQVLFNLLTNALKFTSAGGHILIETKRKEDHAVVAVRDSGLGLRAEDIQRLFRPFSQVHDPMQKTHGGSGLGLYISQGIVELHGGDIWCESDGPGKGSVFTFTLPFVPPVVHVPRARPEPVVDAKPLEEDTVVRRARELI